MSYALHNNNINATTAATGRSAEDEELISTMKKKIMDLGRQLVKVTKKNSRLVGDLEASEEDVLYLSKRFQQYQGGEGPPSPTVVSDIQSLCTVDADDNYSVIKENEIINNEGNNDSNNNNNNEQVIKALFHVLKVAKQENKKLRNEVLDLREKYQYSQLENEELQEEKNFHLAKSSELLKLLEKANCAITTNNSSTSTSSGCIINNNDAAADAKEALHYKSLECVDVKTKLRITQEQLEKTKHVIQNFQKNQSDNGSSDDEKDDSIFKKSKTKTTSNNIIMSKSTRRNESKDHHQNDDNDIDFLEERFKTLQDERERCIEKSVFLSEVLVNIKEELDDMYHRSMTMMSETTSASTDSKGSSSSSFSSSW